MATHIIGDINNYKQHPYYEKPNKVFRHIIGKALRHKSKIDIAKSNVETPQPPEDNHDQY